MAIKPGNLEFDNLRKKKTWNLGIFEKNPEKSGILYKQKKVPDDTKYFCQWCKFTGSLSTTGK